MTTGVGLAWFSDGVGVISREDIVGVVVLPVESLGCGTRERTAKYSRNTEATRARIKARVGARFFRELMKPTRIGL